MTTNGGGEWKEYQVHVLKKLEHLEKMQEDISKNLQLLSLEFTEIKTTVRTTAQNKSLIIGAISGSVFGMLAQIAMQFFKSE